MFWKEWLSLKNMNWETLCDRKVPLEVLGKIWDEEFQEWIDEK